MSTIRTDNLRTLDDALNIPLTTIALKSELNAGAVSVVPTGGISQTNVQAALAGLDTRVTARQPLDATLTGLAGVTTSADTMIYATGADTFAVAPLTSFARTLLDDTTAAAMRTTLGVSAVNTRQLATAWVNFNAVGTVTIRDSYNVSSITDNGVATFTVNFTTPMTNTNYVTTGSTTGVAAANYPCAVSSRRATDQAVGSVGIWALYLTNTGVASLSDPEQVNVVIYGGV